MKEVQILLVEDNEGDVILTREAFKDSKIKNHISVARDGEEALKTLYGQHPLPDLILLDINLPKVDGLEVLATIKQDDRLKAIPVIMLTTSMAERDINFSNRDDANFFITKPVDLYKFMEVVKTIETFWISIVRPLSQTN
jgi:two-component system, chemotaxis family, response regulator Rcp1